MNEHYIKEIFHSLGLNTVQASEITGKRNNYMYMVYRENCETLDFVGQIMDSLTLDWEIMLLKGEVTPQLHRNWYRKGSDHSRKAAALLELKQHHTFQQLADMAGITITAMILNASKDNCKVKTLTSLAKATGQSLIIRYRKKNIPDAPIQIQYIYRHQEDAPDIHKEDTEAL